MKSITALFATTFVVAAIVLVPSSASAMSLVYVDANATTTPDGTEAAPYNTIQDAVDAVDAGGTINVLAGTYTGATINKAVTLEGTDATFNSGDQVLNVTTTDEVTIDGFDFIGTSRAISAVEHANLVIKNNSIENTVSDGTLYFANLDSFVFTDNKLSHLSTDSSDGIFMAGNWNGTTGTVVTITGNTFEDSDMSGMNLSNVTGEISGNTFKNIMYYGILLANNTGGTKVTDNTFDGIKTPDTTVRTYGAGVRFYTPSLTDSVEISDNKFINSYIGIGVRDAGQNLSGLVSGDGNVFENNTYDVYHEGQGTLDFAGNYWGFSTGPATGAITGAAAASVVFDPFCTNENCTIDPVATSTEPVVVASGGGHSGGGTHNHTPATDTTAPATPSAEDTSSAEGQVLGAEDFRFTMNLGIGMSGNDVMELQKRLRAEGFFTFATDTGYFGPITLAAVKAYQTAHPSIGFVTGFVGELTRAELNK